MMLGGAAKTQAADHASRPAIALPSCILAENLDARYGPRAGFEPPSRSCPLWAMKLELRAHADP